MTEEYFADITLRDYFAIQMAPLAFKSKKKEAAILLEGFEKLGVYDPENVTDEERKHLDEAFLIGFAKAAYSLADALLKERKNVDTTTPA